jgi:hypothetical protein
MSQTNAHSSTESATGSTAIHAVPAKQWNKVCRKILDRGTIAENLNYLEVLYGMTSKTIKMIETFDLTHTKVDSHAVYRALDPDPQELAVVNAMDLVAQRHITINERIKCAYFPQSAGYSSSWTCVWDFLNSCRQRRNFFAHEYRQSSDNDAEIFQEMKDLYLPVLPALEVLISKSQAALDDTDNWEDDKDVRLFQEHEPEYSRDSDLMEAEARRLAEGKAAREAEQQIERDAAQEAEQESFFPDPMRTQGLDHTPPKDVKTGTSWSLGNKLRGCLRTFLRLTCKAKFFRKIVVEFCRAADQVVLKPEELADQEWGDGTN